MSEVVPALPNRASLPALKPNAAQREGGQGNLRARTEHALLAHYAQVGVLVNARGDILHIYGRTGKYLEPAPGDAGMNILPMAREGLRRALATALHKAVTHKAMTKHPGIQVRTNGDFIIANLTVQPLATTGDQTTPDLFLIILEEAPVTHAGETQQPAPEGEMPSGAEAERRIGVLEQELRAREEYLQTTFEEMETSNEELKSTNEELQSVNEELQSTNEELETSKEELQSVNEELATVNAELQAKVADLSRANNDMNNLLAGTGVGTLFVDHQLKIARFTPATTQIINLIQSDVGRPVAHLVSNLVGYDRLVDDVRAVLDTLVPIEAEVQTKAGAWYLMRIRPYRTLENVIEGAVLTFVDVSQRKLAETALQTTKDELNALVSTKIADLERTGNGLRRELAAVFAVVTDGLAQLDADLRFVRVTPRFASLYGQSADTMIGRKPAEIVPERTKQIEQATARLIETGLPGIEVNVETVGATSSRARRVEIWHPMTADTGSITGFLVLAQETIDGSTIAAESHIGL